MNARGLPPLFGAPWEREEQEVARNVTTAILVMEHRGQTRIASDLYYLALGKQ